MREGGEALLRIVGRASSSAALDATLTLPWALRQRSRFRTQLDDGREAGVWMPRGEILCDGDRLETEDGRCVEILAAAEKVAVARSQDVSQLARACYHLGNRHVPLQIEADSVRFQPDHVLEDMLCQLGLSVRHETLPFQPEPGAYGRGGHSHAHSHDQDDARDHGHEHSHG